MKPLKTTCIFCFPISCHENQTSIPYRCDFSALLKEVHKQIKKTTLIEQFCDKCNLSFYAENKMNFCSPACGLDFMFDPLEFYREQIYSYIIKHHPEVDISKDDKLLEYKKLILGFKLFLRKPLCDKELTASNIFFFDVERLRNRKQITSYEEFNAPYGKQIRDPMSHIWMNLAISLSGRSTCIRNNVGAVITDENMKRVISIGYNGNAPKLVNACDTLEPGKCGCIHAEINAIANASESLTNKKLFITVSPCASCAKMILSAGINSVTYLKQYRTDEGIKLLENNSVLIRQVD